jgi:hypothetical protein
MSHSIRSETRADTLPLFIYKAASVRIQLNCLILNFNITTLIQIKTYLNCWNLYPHINNICIFIYTYQLVINTINTGLLTRPDHLRTKNLDVWENL